MILISLVLAVLAARYIDFARTEQRYLWVERYSTGFAAWLLHNGVGNAWLLVLALWLPVVIVVTIVFMLLHHWLFGLVGVVINLVLLWYCLWPLDDQQLQVEGIKKSDDAEKAAVTIDEQGEITSDGAASIVEQRHISEHLLIDPNAQIFAVIFWFAVFGGIGAVLYRMLHLLERQAEKQQALAVAQPVLSLLKKLFDWIPARLLALSYVIAGDFSASFGRWLHLAFKGLNSTSDLLVQTGLAALGFNKEQATDADENRLARQLQDRALIVWLVLIAIFTLGSWLY